MTEDKYEHELLNAFRCLDRHEKEIIIGKIFEIIENKKKIKSTFLKNIKFSIFL